MNAEISPRIAFLKADVMSRNSSAHGSFTVGANPYLWDVSLWKSWKPVHSRVQQRAAHVLEQVRLAGLDVYPGWTLAGEHINAYGSMTMGKPDETMQKRLDEFELSPSEKEDVKNRVLLWHGSDGKQDIAQYYATGDISPENNIGLGQWGLGDSGIVFLARGWTENHSIRDYAKVIRIGYDGIRKEIEKKLAKADISDPDFSRKENFWKAGLMICEAGILLGQRYADLANNRADAQKNPQEKKRFRIMAETCARVPRKGARTLFEAAQALWFAHILTCAEDGINANSLGRLDQIFNPYYLADLKSGCVTREQAVELMEELACKLYLDYDVQAITLGGVDKNGKDAVNEMSYIILEATANVGFIRDVSVRLHSKSPDAFIRQAAAMIARGGGIPFLFNDDCFIKALSDRGIRLEDARDYAPIGCIELTIPGRANPHAVSGWFNSTKCLELAFFGGQDPRTGRQLGPKTGTLEDYKTFNDLLKAYFTQVEFFARRMVYFCNRGELAQRERGPLPCWSLLTDDCIKRGRDITDGGAVYNYHSICFLGTANTADSLMAVRKLLYDEKKIGARKLLQALKNNFSGMESLRKMLLTQAPKYGNDQPEVDALAARVTGHFIDFMDKMKSPLNGRYFVHLFSFFINIAFGKSVGATPDGRRSEEPLAYSLSAHQGRDVKGVTAMLNSLSKLPHERAAGASAAIIEVDPVLVEGKAGVERLVQLIKTAIDMKVGQLQWNVVTIERLKKAQNDPEHYGNIAVRVAGYSQMFKLINRELQDHIIARTKHKI